MARSRRLMLLPDHAKGNEALLSAASLLRREAPLGCYVRASFEGALGCFRHRVGRNGSHADGSEYRSDSNRGRGVGFHLQSPKLITIQAQLTDEGNGSFGLTRVQTRGSAYALRVGACNWVGPTRSGENVPKLHCS
jgi:hypothetical protein